MFNSFPKIKALHNVVLASKYSPYFDAPGNAIVYRAKVKLHGTNAGINITKNGVFPQSRSQAISVGKDNAGFAAFVDDTEAYWAEIPYRINQFDDTEFCLSSEEETVTVFGEWFGQGIQKGTAASHIEGKHFGVFAIQVGDSDSDTSSVIVDPTLITSILRAPVIGHNPDNVHVIPWHSEETISIDFFYGKGDDKDIYTDELVFMNKLVEEIEASDPWIKEVFDVDGTGEGVVFYPYADKPIIDRWKFSEYLFKAKGEKHKTVKQRESVQLAPEVVSGINAFVDTVLTDARLEQGVREVARGELVFESKLIGAFIGWVNRDVHSENTDELNAAELEWKPVSKALAERSRTWYMRKLKEEAGLSI